MIYLFYMYFVCMLYRIYCMNPYITDIKFTFLRMLSYLMLHSVAHWVMPVSIFYLCFANCYCYLGLVYASLRFALSYDCIYLLSMHLYASLTVVAILSLFMIVSIFYLCVFLANCCCYLIFVYAWIYLLSMYLYASLRFALKMLCKLLLLSYLCLYLYLSFIFVYALLTVVAALSSFMFGSIFYLCVFFANCCCYLIFVYASLRFALSYDWVFPLSLCIPCKLLLLSYLRLWLDLFFIFVYACNFISFRKEQ